MVKLNAETAMNLVGLILIAGLSGVIVAVSLRLRAPTSSARMWLEGQGLPEEDLQSPLYSAAKDLFGGVMRRT